MTNILITASIVYLGIVAALYFFQRHLLYHPSHAVPQQSVSGVPDMATHHVVSADGIGLRVWYAPAKEGWPVMLYFHGNAGHIGGRGFKVRPFIDAGYGVLLASYRGFGGNAGTPSEEGLYADARAAIGFLVAQGIAPARIVLYGESLGSGVAVRMGYELAQQGTPAGAVVLEAPFTSIPDVAAAHYPYIPVRYLVRDHFDSLGRVASIGVPLLIVHGESDPTVPVKFGRRLFAAAVEPKEAQWIAGGRHNDLADFGLFQRVDAFLGRRLRFLTGQN